MCVPPHWRTHRQHARGLRPDRTPEIWLSRLKERKVLGRIDRALAGSENSRVESLATSFAHPYYPDRHPPRRESPSFVLATHLRKQTAVDGQR